MKRILNDLEHRLVGLRCAQTTQYGPKSLIVFSVYSFAHASAVVSGFARKPHIVLKNFTKVEIKSPWNVGILFR